MNKKDSGVQWLGVPVFIVDEDAGPFRRVDIATNDKDNPEPMFFVGQALFDDVQRDFENNRVQLDYMLRQFKRGKIEPLNEAARIEDARCEAESNN